MHSLNEANKLLHNNLSKTETRTLSSDIITILNGLNFLYISFNYKKISSQKKFNLIANNQIEFTDNLNLNNSLNAHNFIYKPKQVSKFFINDFICSNYQFINNPAYFTSKHTIFNISDLDFNMPTLNINVNDKSFFKIIITKKLNNFLLNSIKSTTKRMLNEEIVENIPIFKKDKNISFSKNYEGLKGILNLIDDLYDYVNELYDLKNKNFDKIYQNLFFLKISFIKYSIINSKFYQNRKFYGNALIRLYSFLELDSLKHIAKNFIIISSIWKELTEALLKLNTENYNDTYFIYNIIDKLTQIYNFEYELFTKLDNVL